jgi:hypothetical protein
MKLATIATATTCSGVARHAKCVTEHGITHQDVVKSWGALIALGFWFCGQFILPGLPIFIPVLMKL